VEAVGSEPFAVSSGEDRLAAGVSTTSLQTKRLLGAWRKKLIQVKNKLEPFAVPSDEDRLAAGVAPTRLLN
jgi:hypothetical protein